MMFWATLANLLVVLANPVTLYFFELIGSECTLL